MKKAILAEIFGYTGGLLLGGLTSFSNNHITSGPVFEDFVLFIPSTVLGVYGIIVFILVMLKLNDPFPFSIEDVR